MSINTRQSERNRLAAHLAASVSYLWLKTLLAVMFGMMLGAGMIATPRLRPAADGAAAAAARAVGLNSTRTRVTV
jgi:hypothetical protein